MVWCRLSAEGTASKVERGPSPFPELALLPPNRFADRCASDASSEPPSPVPSASMNKAIMLSDIGAEGKSGMRSPPCYPRSLPLLLRPAIPMPMSLLPFSTSSSTTPHLPRLPTGPTYIDHESESLGTSNTWSVTSESTAKLPMPTMCRWMIPNPSRVIRLGHRTVAPLIPQPSTLTPVVIPRFHLPT